MNFGNLVSLTKEFQGKKKEHLLPFGNNEIIIIYIFIFPRNLCSLKCIFNSFRMFWFFRIKIKYLWIVGKISIKPMMGYTGHW